MSDNVISGRIFAEKKAEVTDNCNLLCIRCKLHAKNNGEDISCDNFEFRFPERAVKIIDKWWEEKVEKERNRINFTPELFTALKGRMAEGSTWIHIVSENHFIFYSKPPVSTYPALIFESVGVQEVWTESFPIYEEMVKKLFRQNIKVVRLKNFVEGARK